MGPTASGKTAQAIMLSRRYPFEIVSVDSAQVYRGMNIGTAKPSDDLLQRFPHRLLDLRDPWESYSAGAFVEDAIKVMHEITEAGRIPLLAGGTMLYFQALQRGLAELPQADAGLRRQLDERAAREGWPALHSQLAELDPVAAARLQPADAQRIQRALEVCLRTGQTLTELQQVTEPKVQADYLNIGLIPADRQQLHESIRVRFEQMMAAGFLGEVDALLERPEMSASAPAMRSVGYRQLGMHLTGELSLEEAVEQAVVATRRLAKRQLTWLRGWPDLHAVDSISAGCGAEIDKIVATWLEGGASLPISR